MQQAGIGVKVIEVVPVVLEQTNGLPVLEFEAYPLLVIALEFEHLVKLLGASPVLQAGAVEQHYATGQRPRGASLARTRAAHQCLALEVAVQQFIDVTHRKDVRIDDQCAPLVSHELRRQESQGCERLQGAGAPDAPQALTQIGLTVAGL